MRRERDLYSIPDMHFLLTFWLAISAQASLMEPSWNRFLRQCLENRSAATAFRLDQSPELEKIEFMPVLALEGTQPHLSFPRLLKKLTKVPSQVRRETGAIYGEKRFLRVVYFRGKLYIVDGHHRALISVYLGARTVPIKVIANLDGLEPEAFRAQMQASGWAYWRDPWGNPKDPVDLCAMTNDPNLGLARLIIRRIDASLTDGVLQMWNSRGPAWAIGLKINEDLAFLENYIADILRADGVEFDDTRGQLDLTYAELKGYLESLKARAAQKTSPLYQFLLFDEPTHVAKLDLDTLVTNHIRTKGCHSLLARSPLEIQQYPGSDRPHAPRESQPHR